MSRRIEIVWFVFKNFFKKIAFKWVYKVVGFTMVFSYPLSLSFVLVHSLLSFVLPHLPCPLLIPPSSPHTALLSCLILSCPVLSSPLSPLPSLCFWDRAPHNSGWPQTHCIVELGLELLIFVSLPLKCWDYKCMCPCAQPSLYCQATNALILPVFLFFSSQLSSKGLFPLDMSHFYFSFLVSRFAPFWVAQ